MLGVVRGTNIREEYVGASLSTAAKVIGVRPDRLIAWADRNLIVPAIQHRVGGTRRRVWTYDFESLVLGRIVRQLEDDHHVHIGQITEILQAVKSWEGDEPLSALEWGAIPGEVFVKYTDGTWHGGRVPNQSVMIGSLDIDAVRAGARSRLQRPLAMAGKTMRRRGLKQNREVFDGTGVLVETVQRFIEHGCSDREILENYPVLFPADVAAARERMSA